MEILPSGRFLLVKPDISKTKRDEISTGGIFLPGSNDDRPDLAVAKAEVLSVGPGVEHYSIGQTVLYNFFSGNQFVVPGKDPLGKDDVAFHLVFEDDILATLMMAEPKTEEVKEV